jgi:hypothetical protein
LFRNSVGLNTRRLPEKANRNTGADSVEQTALLQRITFAAVQGAECQ